MFFISELFQGIRCFWARRGHRVHIVSTTNVLELSTIPMRLK